MKLFQALACSVMLIPVVAGAQITCQTYGQTTTCNGALGSSTQPLVSVPPVDVWKAQAQRDALEAQAELSRVQADAIRKQTEAGASLQRNAAATAQQQSAHQQFLNKVSIASDADLRNVEANLKDLLAAHDCGLSTSCQEDREFAERAVNAEIQRRAQSPAATTEGIAAKISVWSKTVQSQSTPDLLSNIDLMSKQLRNASPGSNESNDDAAWLSVANAELERRKATP